MKDFLYPTIIQDNFFDDPDDIVEFANMQTFVPGTRGLWPGKRANIISLQQGNNTYTKFTRIVMDRMKEIGRFSVLPPQTQLNSQAKLNFKVQMSFQSITPHHSEPDHILNRGFIHHDHAKSDTDESITQMTCIVFLNQTVNTMCGTSLYRTNLEADDVYTATDLKKHVNLHSSLPNNSNDLPDLQRHYDQFQETLRIYPVYNRLVTFDSRLWHGATCLHTGTNEPRLTLVVFIGL